MGFALSGTGNTITLDYQSKVNVINWMILKLIIIDSKSMGISRFTNDARKAFHLNKVISDGLSVWIYKCISED